MDAEDHNIEFSKWIRSPQTLIALSAVLLSLCGLFISIYEAKLIREQQYASVWPNLEIAPSVNPGDLKIFVQNTGIGPARIINAKVTYQDKLLADWGDLLNNFSYEKANYSGYQSLIKGRVLPPDSDQELIFRIESVSQNSDPILTRKLSEEIGNGNIDVQLCYCSVYDDCWSINMSDVTRRTRGEKVNTREEQKVESCYSRSESGI